MSGPRAQFGRRAAVGSTVVHPTAVEAAPAGRAEARRRVSTAGRGLRSRLAVPVLGVAVVALTWVDAGVLRAEDGPARSTANEPRVPLPSRDSAPGPVHAEPVGAGPAVAAAVPDEAEAPDAGELEQEE